MTADVAAGAPEAPKTSSAHSAQVDCNHGKWDAKQQTCICDAGWVTDVEQDILSGITVWCSLPYYGGDKGGDGSPGTAPSTPGLPSPPTIPGLPRPGPDLLRPERVSVTTIVGVIVGGGVVALLLACGLYFFCCRERHSRRRRRHGSISSTADGVDRSSLTAEAGGALATGVYTAGVPLCVNGDPPHLAHRSVDKPDSGYLLSHTKDTSNKAITTTTISNSGSSKASRDAGASLSVSSLPFGSGAVDAMAYAQARPPVSRRMPPAPRTPPLIVGSLPFGGDDDDNDEDKRYGGRADGAAGVLVVPGRRGGRVGQPYDTPTPPPPPSAGGVFALAACSGNGGDGGVTMCLLPGALRGGNGGDGGVIRSIQALRRPITTLVLANGGAGYDDAARHASAALPLRDDTLPVVPYASAPQQQGRRPQMPPSQSRWQRNRGVAATYDVDEDSSDRDDGEWRRVYVVRDGAASGGVVTHVQHQYAG